MKGAEIIINSSPVSGNTGFSYLFSSLWEEYAKGQLFLRGWRVMAVVVVKQNNNDFHPPYGPDFATLRRGPLPPKGAELKMRR
jgi:hypothetical protein